MTTSKKIAVGFGISFLLLLGAAALIPLVVDVDQYRPKLVEAATQQINGKLELGKLRLSIWGRIQVGISGLKLMDASGKPVVSVNDASFLLPFSSIFGGSPRVTLELKDPEITVTKDAKGTLNVMTLIRSVPAGSAEPSKDPATKPSESSAPSVVLPGIVARARLGLRIQNGRLAYEDFASGTRASIRKLDVDWSDASLSDASRLKVGCELDTRVGELATVKGPVTFSMDARPIIQGGTLGQIGIDLNADASALEIAAAGVFKKAAGVPIELAAKFGAGQKEVRLDSFKARFGQAELTGAGQVSLAGASPQVAIKLSSNAIALKSFESMVEMLKPYALSGTASLAAELKGPTAAFKYSGTFTTSGIGFDHPMFKKRPSIDGKVAFSNDSIDSMEFKFTAPATEFLLKGGLKGFLKPVFTVALTSSAADFDQWIEWPAPAAASAKSADAGSKAGTAAVTAKAAASDLDAMLDPLRKNTIAAATQGMFTAQLKSVRAKKAEITDIAASLRMLPGLAFQLDSASLKAYGGAISAKAKFGLMPEAPTYQFSADLKGLDLQKAVESQFSMLKNTLLGRLSASVTGVGSSFDPTRATQRLSLSGDFSVANGQFATMDIGKFAVEGINQAVAKAAEKVPALKGRQLNVSKGRDTRYQVIRSKFQMNGGKFSAPDFTAVAEKDKGIDMKGALKMDLVNHDLNGRFELTDTYNVTGARDLSVDLAGQKVDAVLAEKGKSVRFPLSVGCKLTQPCPSYTELPEHFAKVVGANLAGGVAAKAKAEVQKKIGEVIKSAPIPQGLKKFFR